MTKNKRKYKSKYSVSKKGKVKKYQPGGMYSDNTVASAGQGSVGTTANKVFDQSNPAVLEQKLEHLQKTKESAMSSSDAIASEIQSEEQASQQQMAAAKAASDAKFTRGEGLLEQGLEKGKSGIKKLQALNDAKTARTALTAGQAGKVASDASAASSIAGAGFGNKARETLATETSGILAGHAPGAGQTALNIPGAGAGSYGLTPSIAPPSLPGVTPPVLPGATDVLAKGADASTKGVDLATKGLEKTVDGASAGGGLGAGLAAYKAQRATNQAIKGGKLAMSSAGSAAGAGWGAMSSAAKGNLIGTAATLAGEGIKRWGPQDNDDTELNTSEWTGELLSGAGTGIGVASTVGTVAGMVGAGALYGSAVPGLGTAIGAVAGLGYGAYKALTGRKKARKAEADALALKKKKVGKYNKSVSEDLASSTMAAKAGELEQKTYSGYDLGRNVVAKKGGMRMGIPRYGYNS